MNFKVGDRVVGTCVIDTRDVIGKLGTIKAIGVCAHSVCFDENIGGWSDKSLGIEAGHGWNCREREIKLVDANQIIIYRKGQEVIANIKEGKKVIKSAKATCNPSDEFDFEFGAKLAFSRLIGEDENTVREVKRPAKIGEWIKATSNGTWHGNKYSVGDTYLVDDNYYTGNAYYHINKSDEIMLDIDEYVVLENYHPEDKPKTHADYTIKELVTELSRRYE